MLALRKVHSTKIYEHSEIPVAGFTPELRVRDAVLLKLGFVPRLLDPTSLPGSLISQPWERSCASSRVARAIHLASPDKLLNQYSAVTHLYCY